MSDAIKLPKQWKDWVRSAGLRPRTSSGDKRGLKSAWFYLQGHGREWRVNDKNEFQCGDTCDDFDRWALCEIQSFPMPKTRADFLVAVRKLLSLHAHSNKD